MQRPNGTTFRIASDGKQHTRRLGRSRQRTGSRSGCSWEEAAEDTVDTCVHKLISNLDDIFEHRSTLPEGKLRQIAADMESQARVAGSGEGAGEGEVLEVDHIKWMGKTKLPSVLWRHVQQKKEQGEQNSGAQAMEGKARLLPPVESLPAQVGSTSGPAAPSTKLHLLRNLSNELRQQLELQSERRRMPADMSFRRMKSSER